MPGITASLLIIESTDTEHKRCPLESFPYTIGRDDECDLTLSDTGISRLHARIERTYGQYSLTDMNSTNGTFINAQQVTDNMILQDGDEIRFATSVVAIFEDPAATGQIEVGKLPLRGIIIDEDRKEVFVNGRLLEPPLSPLQYALLALLVQREGQIVSRDDIAISVWPDETNITDQMIDTLVSRLRKRLSEFDADDHIVTRRGFGLMFVREPQEER